MFNISLISSFLFKVINIIVKNSQSLFFLISNAKTKALHIKISNLFNKVFKPNLKTI